MDEQQRLAAIESRLVNIETFLARAFPPSAAEKAAAGRVNRAPAQEPAAKDQPPAGIRFVQKAKPTESANWLAIVAVICFVLAAGFIIKLAIDADWLTPIRQVGLAAVFGVALIFAGLQLLATDREYSSYLPAAGIIVLYLTAYAAHRWHGLLSYEMALAMTSVVSVICIWLFFEIKSEIYPIMAAVGTYLSPIILFTSGNDFILYYYVVCSVAFAAISIYADTRTLAIVGAYASVLCTALMGRYTSDPFQVWAFLLIHAVIYSGGSFYHTKQSQQSMTEQHAMAFFPVLVIFYASQYYFLEKAMPLTAPILSLAFAGFILLLYFAAKKSLGGEDLASQAIVFGFASIVVFHSFYLVLLPEDYRPFLMILLIAAFALPSVNTGTKPAKEFQIPMLAVGAIVLIELWRLVWNLIAGKDTAAPMVGLCTVIAMWVVLVMSRKKLSEVVYQQFLGATHVLSVLVCYRLVKEIGSIAVSASWLFYAVAVLGFSYTRKDRVMARSALMVLAFAAVKALLFDASSAPSLVRILCLLMTGAVLYGSGLLLRRIQSW